jgi:hypothetical protein
MVSKFLKHKPRLRIIPRSLVQLCALPNSSDSSLPKQQHTIYDTFCDYKVREFLFIRSCRRNAIDRSCPVTFCRQIPHFACRLELKTRGCWFLSLLGGLSNTDSSVPIAIDKKEWALIVLFMSRGLLFRFIVDRRGLRPGPFNHFGVSK